MQHVQHALRQVGQRTGERRAALNRAGQGDHGAHLALRNPLPCRLGQVRGQMLANQPDGATTHLIEPLAARAAEQLTLGDGPLHVQPARRHERLSAHCTVREEKHGGKSDFGLRRHLAQVQQR